MTYTHVVTYVVNLVHVIHSVHTPLSVIHRSYRMTEKNACVSLTCNEMLKDRSRDPIPILFPLMALITDHVYSMLITRCAQY